MRVMPLPSHQPQEPARRKPIGRARVHVSDVDGKEFKIAPDGPLPCPVNKGRKRRAVISHERERIVHRASQGSSKSTRNSAKSFTLRVTRVRSCSSAVAAIMPSAVLSGVPLA